MWRFVVQEAGRSKLHALPRWMRRLPSWFLYALITRNIMSTHADVLCGRPWSLTFWAENWHTGYSCSGKRTHRFCFFFYAFSFTS